MFWQLFSKKEATGKTQARPDASTQPVKQQPADDGEGRKPVKLPLSLLKKLMPIGQLSEAELGQLDIRITQFPAGSVIFKNAGVSDSLIYLIEGSVFLEAGNGSGYEITAGTLKALYPLSNGSLHNMTAFARSAAKVIYIPQQAMCQVPIDHRFSF